MIISYPKGHNGSEAYWVDLYSGTSFVKMDFWPKRSETTSLAPLGFIVLIGLKYFLKCCLEQCYSWVPQKTFFFPSLK